MPELLFTILVKPNLFPIIRIKPYREPVGMKKLIPLLLLVLTVVFGALIFKNFITSSVIILKDNTRIVVDETWVKDDKVFYRHKDETDFVPIDKVRKIEQGGVREGSGIARFMQKQIDTGKETADGLMTRVSPGNLKKKPLFIRWALGLAGILLCIVFAVVLLRKRRSGTPPKQAVEKKTHPAETAETVEADVDYRGREIVVEHFLKVFKAQKGADDDAPTALKPLAPPAPDGNRIYELRVKIGDEWATRRMSLGRIGEDSGSRSRCYYVIYDDHLVVKIPPYPIKNFNIYLERLQKEAGIAGKLAPRECLVPSISVILKKVHPFYDDGSLPPEALERKYIDWIEDNQAFREFLKIEGAYAYFMDLSKYYFLASIIDGMHDPRRNFAKEITDHPDVPWDTMAFEARYGHGRSAICDDIQSVYNRFESRVKEFLRQNSVENAVQNFQIKEWFLTFLSKGRLSSADFDMKSGMASGLHGIANKLFKEKRTSVDAYRGMIASYVANKSLTRNKAQISSMITNLLDLLAWLHNRKVAMRDLKPDNLLIAGDPTKFPQFLESASLYSVGLIDVETAAWLETEGGREIEQPPLGGTPAFATPTHTFPNNIIQKIYGDPSLILYLQDWYAAVAMVFHMVTGKRLFTDTAKTLMKIKKDIKEGVKSKNRMPELLGKTSRIFWTHAVAEFDGKLGAEGKKVNYISMIMSPDTRDMLRPILNATHRQINASIKGLILKQQIFKSGKLKKALYSASFMKVNRFKAKLTGDAAADMSAEKKTRALALLDELEALKRNSACLIGPAKVLEKSTPIISAHDLLQAMFTIVLTHMHENVWGVLKR